MQTRLTGALGLAPSGGGVGATSSIDTESDLGLSDPSGSMQLRAELDTGPIRVTGSAFGYSESGEGRLTGSFGDIQAGTDVSSDLDLGNLKAAVTFDLVDTGVFRFSPGLAVDMFLVEAQITEALTSATETIDEFLPLPMLFAQAELDLGQVSGIVEAGFVALDLTDTNGTYFDFEAMVAFEPMSQLELYAGYRYISLDGEGENDGQALTADLVLQGWFVGGGVRF